MDSPHHYDKHRVRQAFDRAADCYDDSAVLQQEVCNRLLEKLDIVRLEARLILDAGSGTGYAIPHLFRRFNRASVMALDLSEKMLARAAQQSSFLHRVYPVCADIEALPFADNSFDLVFSNLSLQWCNDLKQAIAEARRVLKPGGLYLFSTFGPDTLKELRTSWAAVDQHHHVNEFIDMHDIGDMLMQTAFAEPVMEAELITLTYQSVTQVLHDLKSIGANVKSLSAMLHQSPGLGGRATIQRLTEHYETYRSNGQLPATYEVVYGHAWKPETNTGKPASDEDKHEKIVVFQR
jgi:malonyl-CoA O-methyltransferase